MTRKCVDALLEGRVDVITAGDHVWDQKDFVNEIRLCPEVLRPANVCPDQPGRGHAVFDDADGTRVGVSQLLGRTFVAMPSDCPFRAADRIIAEFAEQGVKVILIDFNAEATSEAIAMGRHLDGRVSACLGTHTPRPTRPFCRRGPPIRPMWAWSAPAIRCSDENIGGTVSLLDRHARPLRRGRTRHPHERHPGAPQPRNWTNPPHQTNHE